MLKKLRGGAQPGNASVGFTAIISVVSVLILAVIVLAGGSNEYHLIESKGSYQVQGYYTPGLGVQLRVVYDENKTMTEQGKVNFRIEGKAWTYQSDLSLDPGEKASCQWVLPTDASTITINVGGSTYKYSTQALSEWGKRDYKSPFPVSLKPGD